MGSLRPPSRRRLVAASASTTRTRPVHIVTVSSSRRPVDSDGNSPVHCVSRFVGGGKHGATPLTILDRRITRVGGIIAHGRFDSCGAGACVLSLQHLSRASVQTKRWAMPCDDRASSMLNHWLLPMVAAHCAATLGRLGVAGASMWQWCSMPRKATRYSIAWLLARPRGDPDVLADGHLGPDGPVLVLGHHIPPFHLVFRQPRPGANRPRNGRHMGRQCR